MHRVLADRAPERYATHGTQITKRVLDRVFAKGLARDELRGRLHLIIDGVGGRTHYVGTENAARRPRSGAAISSRSIQLR
jgi:hypothetical protein